MKKYSFLISLICFSINANAQLTHLQSLYKQIMDGIYRSYYNPNYMNREQSTITFLKMEIDNNGNVGEPVFSDTADSVFINAYKVRQEKYGTKDALKEYVKIKGYKATSLIFPISFITVKSRGQEYLPHPEKLMQFKGKDFDDPAVIFRTIFIPISNMNY